MNNDQISEAFNNISDRQIRKNDIELLMNESKRGVSRAKKIAFAVICAAVLSAVGLTAAAAVTKGFTVTEGFDKFWKIPFIRFSAASAEDSPKTIEKIYTPTVLPEGKSYDYSAGLNSENTRFTAIYSTPLEDQQLFPFDRDIYFYQYTRGSFSGMVENQTYVEITETKVNDCPAYLAVNEHYYGYDNALYWDHGDYIFYMWGNVSGDELIRIAESIAVNENAIWEGKIS